VTRAGDATTGSGIRDFATETFEGDRVRFGAASSAGVEAVDGAISSAVSSKSKTSMFSTMRWGFVDCGRSAAAVP